MQDTLQSTAAASGLQGELEGLLRHQPELIDFLCRGPLQGVWVWSLEDPTQGWVSQEFWSALGYSAGEMAQAPQAWWRLVHPDDRHIAQESFIRHLDDPQQPYDHVVRYLHRDGHLVWMRSRGIVIRTPDGGPGRMVGTHTDITEQKALEDQLRERTEDLQRRNRELQQFAYAASHDLQGPARRILGFAEWLLADFGEELPDRAKEYVGRILASASAMAEMSQGILQYSRLDREGPRRERVELEEVLQCVLPALDDVPDQVAFSLYRDPLPAVIGSRNLLEQLLSNLLQNCIRYRADRALEIRITARERGRVCEIRIADNGIGFDNSERARIFDLFHRLHRQAEIPGSGLGLAICQKIVTRHGGQIAAEGQPGKGATFTFTLPLAAPANAHRVLTPLPPLPARPTPP